MTSSAVPICIRGSKLAITVPAHNGAKPSADTLLATQNRLFFIFKFPFALNWGKWLTFYERNFSRFVESKLLYFDPNFAEIYSQGLS